MPRLPLALLALVLAGPALADGVPGSAGRGLEGPDRARVHRGHAHHPRRFVRASHRIAPMPPAGPVAYAWPEPAEVRVPIYNRPSHLPAW